MYNDYNENDYKWIKELMLYPQTLEKHLNYLRDTSQIKVPDDPIEKVIFQDNAKKAIRKIAQNKAISPETIGLPIPSSNASMNR